MTRDELLDSIQCCLKDGEYENRTCGSCPSMQMGPNYSGSTVICKRLLREIRDWLMAEEAYDEEREEAPT